MGLACFISFIHTIHSSTSSTIYAYHIYMLSAQENVVNTKHHVCMYGDALKPSNGAELTHNLQGTFLTIQTCANICCWQNRIQRFIIVWVMQIKNRTTRLHECVQSRKLELLLSRTTCAPKPRFEDLISVLLQWCCRITPSQHRGIAYFQDFGSHSLGPANGKYTLLTTATKNWNQ
jgi:hypothetical protein